MKFAIFTNSLNISPTTIPFKKSDEVGNIHQPVKTMGPEKLYARKEFTGP